MNRMNPPKRWRVALAMLFACFAGASRPALPLGMDLTLAVDAQYRARLGTGGGVPESPEQPESGTSLTQRARVGLSLSRTEGPTVRLSVQDAWTWGSAPFFEPYGSARGLEAYEAFALLPLGPRARLVLGRQEVAFDNQRLVSNAPHSSSGQSFDAVRFEYELRPVSLDVFYARAPVRGPAGPLEQQDGSFGGARSHFDADEALEISVALFVRHLRAVGTRQTLGTFAAGALGPFDYSAEAYVQTGVEDDQVISAHLWAARLAYTAPITWRPTLSLWVDYLSGDGTPYGTFDTLYAENHDQYGLMDRFVHPHNDTLGLGLVDVALRGGWVLLRRLEVFVDVHRFMAPTRSTAAQGAQSSLFGEEVDVSADLELTRGARFRAFGGVLLPGNALRPRFSVRRDQPFGPQWLAHGTLEVVF